MFFCEKTHVFIGVIVVESVPTNDPEVAADALKKIEERYGWNSEHLPEQAKAMFNSMKEEKPSVASKFMMREKHSVTKDTWYGEPSLRDRPTRSRRSAPTLAQSCTRQAQSVIVTTPPSDGLDHGRHHHDRILPGLKLRAPGAPCERPAPTGLWRRRRDLRRPLWSVRDQTRG